MGLWSFNWTDHRPSPGIIIVSVVHLTELRVALNEAYQAANQTPRTYTGPAVAAGFTVIQAITWTSYAPPYGGYSPTGGDT